MPDQRPLYYRIQRIRGKHPSTDVHTALSRELQSSSAQDCSALCDTVWEYILKAGGKLPMRSDADAQSESLARRWKTLCDRIAKAPESITRATRDQAERMHREQPLLGAVLAAAEEKAAQAYQDFARSHNAQPMRLPLL